MNFFWSPFPTKGSTKTHQNSAENSGQDSGRKFQKFGELSFCNFSNLCNGTKNVCLSGPKNPWQPETWQDFTRHFSRPGKQGIFSRILVEFLTKLHKRAGAKGKKTAGQWRKFLDFRGEWRKFLEIADFCRLSWSNVFWVYVPFLLAMGKYGCTEVRVYPAECGEQLRTDPSKIGSSKSLVLESFSGEGIPKMGLVPASPPDTLGYACTFYAPTSPPPILAWENGIFGQLPRHMLGLRGVYFRLPSVPKLFRK